MATETELEVRAEKAAARLCAAAEKRKELEARMQKANVRAAKAESYRKIMNLMSAHVHCCLNQDYEEELDKYWSKRDDIVYANGNLAYVGQEAVRRYYVDGAKARAAEARARLAAAGKPVPEGDKIPGYKNMNLIGTPYVEIAEDGQTAQGIWMAHSFQGQVCENGELETQGLLSRYSGEFILEDGEWKIWHRRQYADVVFEENVAKLVGPPPSKDGKPGKPMCENRKHTDLTKIHAPSCMYSETALPVGEPKLPEAYDTWTYETSNVVKEGSF